MEFKPFLCLFLMFVCLCLMAYGENELMRPFMSTMENIMLFGLLIYSEAILLRCTSRNTSNRNTEDQNSREASIVAVTIRQNYNENPTPKPKPPSQLIPTAKVKGTKRNSRVQKDYLSTPRSKKGGNNGPKTAVSEAVRENIKLIENDLKVKESSLLDEMQGYLTEGEVDKITKASRKDQAHYFAAIIEEYDDILFLEVLHILTKSFFGHISSKLRESYEKHQLTQIPNTSCVICRIQTEVDIKSIRCELIKEELLSKDLKHLINDCKTSKGHQHVLWEALFFHLKRLQPKQKIAEKFINIFKETKHIDLFTYLSWHGLPYYECSCDKNSIQTDNLRSTSSTPSSIVTDESTTSLLETHQESSWFQEAVHSSSSEEGAKPYQLLKRLSPRSGKIAPVNRKNGRAHASTTLPRCKANSDASTTSLESNSGFYTFKLIKMTSTRNSIDHQKPRPVKRTRNSENSPTENNTNSSTEEGTLHTVPKTPYETEDCLPKRQRVLSVLRFISESDVNSDGETVKKYHFPVNHTSIFPKTGDIGPMAFAKTHINKNETQIY